MDFPRRTKIIATIGPATDTDERMRQLVEAGMDIARLNMSHASHEQAAATTERIRRAAEAVGRPVGILMDTQGPAIRTGDLPVALDLNPGDVIALTVRGETSEEYQSVDVNYDQLIDDISVGDVVVVDNGAMNLKVLEKHHNRLNCEVLT
ncbi:MAG: pyruvate kinase, partial [Phycisphaeraceae bacterium]|nr:pyruvate kinase [Phycisphaeraceae bacterium]